VTSEKENKKRQKGEKGSEGKKGREVGIGGRLRDAEYFKHQTMTKKRNYCMESRG